MKKSFSGLKRNPCFKLGFLSCLLTFSFLVFSQADGMAQSTYNQAANPKSLDYVHQGPFVSKEVAIQRLDAEITSLRSQMIHMVEGSAAYRTAYRKVLYYTGIKSHLEYSVVKDAIVSGLSVIRTNFGQYGGTEAEAQAEKAIAIDLLKS